MIFSPHRPISISTEYPGPGSRPQAPSSCGPMRPHSLQRCLQARRLPMWRATSARRAKPFSRLICDACQLGILSARRAPAGVVAGLRAACLQRIPQRIAQTAALQARVRALFRLDPLLATCLLPLAGPSFLRPRCSVPERLGFCSCLLPYASGWVRPLAGAFVVDAPRHRHADTGTVSGARVAVLLGSSLRTTARGILACGSAWANSIATWESSRMTSYPAWSSP